MSERSAAVPQRRLTAALGAAVILCALFGALLSSSLPLTTRQDVSALGFVIGGLAVLTSAGLAARRSQGPRRRAWTLLASASAVAVLGNAWVGLRGIDSVTNPSVVGEGSIAIALLLSVVGLLGLHASRQRGAELTLMALDGVVMGCAVLVTASIVVYTRMLESTTGSMLAGAGGMLFLLLDVALATVAALLIVRSQGNREFFSLIGFGFLLYAVADLTYLVEAASGDFRFGTVHDLAWIAGYLLLAVSAWHPDASAAPTDEQPGTTSDVEGTVLIFVILLAAVTVQLLYPQQDGFTSTQMVLWVLLVLAAGARQTLLTASNAALRLGLEERVREQTADLRRMARQTEVLLRSVGDGIYGVDLEGRITFVNPSGAEALGHRPESLLGRRAHDEFHGAQPDGTPYPWTGCYVTEAIDHGQVSSAEEDNYVRSDGTSFPVEITSSPLVDGNRISGAVVVFRDVTQRHEVDRMKNEFLSIVSHELRTPLTSIRGSLGLIASGALVELTPQAERIVAIAVESSDRLTRLINDILDMDRIQSGTLPMNVVPHAAADLLQAAATGVAELARAADVRLQVVPSTGRVLADRDRIVQTLTNLLGNAIKFSSPGSAVRLGAAVGDIHLTFSVRDHGRGIPAEMLEAVFQPFKQVDSSDAREKGGTGLGLAISREIVERHGGRIWAESENGTGTTVRFTVPRFRDAGNDDVVSAHDEGQPAGALALATYDVAGGELR
jgi:PAS domain S-box-containing protein